MPNDDSPIYIVDGLAEASRGDRPGNGFAVYNPKGMLPPIIRQGDRLAEVKDYLGLVSAEDF